MEKINIKSFKIIILIKNNILIYYVVISVIINVINKNQIKL